MSKALSQLWLRVIAALLILGVCLGLLLGLWPKAPPIPLVKQDGWQIEGRFFQFPPQGVSKLDMPEQLLINRHLVLWRSWSPETGNTAGTIRTQSFELSRFLAVPYFGFPREQPPNRIFLRC